MSFNPALGERDLRPCFQRASARVAIRRAASYQGDLREVLTETLREFDLGLRGKKVLLKPNFVEPGLGRPINTHPALIAAAREAFFQLGASVVWVGEGPGHERDTQSILEAIRLHEYLGPLRDVFVDLNTDDVEPVALRTNASGLRELYLPRTVLEADFVVSMPKLKTHHWAGATLSLKNMFGIVPGCCYGWPKNILHWKGITNSILDINSTVRPDFAIVDGILAMEGNGPIQGNPKAANVIVLGDDPVAVDSTCARIMGLDPGKVRHIAQAGLLLGQMREDRIEIFGETLASVRSPFEVVPELRHLCAGRRAAAS